MVKSKRSTRKDGWYALFLAAQTQQRQVTVYYKRWRSELVRTDSGMERLHAILRSDTPSEGYGRYHMKLCFLIAVLGAIAAGESVAGSLTCAPYGGGAYCQYDGKGAEAYVNAYDLIHVYFDQSFDISVPAQVGFNVSSASVAVVPISANPDFAKMFYSTVLSAQARSAAVRIQMTSTSGGYLRADRIWVIE